MENACIIVSLVYMVLACILTWAKSSVSLIRKLIRFLLPLAALTYLVHPALNLHAIGTWLFVIGFICYGVLLFSDKPFEETPNKKRTAKNSTIKVVNPKPLYIIAWILGVCAGLHLIAGIIYSPLLQSQKYARRIEVSEAAFSEIPAFRFQETAIIDRSSAELLGDKVMGQMTDLVSQFSVSDEYSQISYKSGTCRVTPLAYDGVIKYFRNKSEGIPGYIVVNTTTGKTELVRLADKMHYVPSAYFNDNLYRRLRMAYPSAIFGNPTFEIDDEGNPWYVCTTYTWAGIRSMKQVNGVILFDPCTGTSQRYNLDEIPSWVDRVYPESLVTQELDDYGKYRNGWLNSWMTQEGVIQTSPGYNYISKNGDIWLYTGMTSASSDESNVGFMLVNLRTHEAQYTATSGASEYAVMDSAEGEVLNYGYTATFPTLINLEGKPVYLLSLKDSAGLVKMYAMVDARDYQRVYTVKAGNSSEQAIASLIKQMGGTSVSIEGEKETFEIKEIRTAVIEGNTVMYFQSDTDTYVLTLTQENAAKALFLTEGDTVTCLVAEAEDGTKTILDLE